MTDLALFSDMAFPIATIVRLSLCLVLGVYSIFSAILYYHWISYGTDPKITSFTLILYFSMTIPLIVVMGILAIII